MVRPVFPVNSRPPIRLTPRELEILGMVARGLTNAQIGTVLGTSPNTVRNQLAGLLTKFDAGSRTELVTVAIGAGVVEPTVGHDVSLVEEPSTTPVTRKVHADFEVDVPDAWVERPSELPQLRVTYEDPAGEDGALGRLCVLVEPFDGDTAAYAELGLRRWQLLGDVLMVGTRKVGPSEHQDAELQMERSSHPVRFLVTCVVRDGVGYVAQVSARASEMRRRRSVLRRVMTSFAPR